MPPPSFRPEEADFLSQFIDEWIAGKLASNKKVPGESTPRNRLVHRVIEEFYAAFPERDVHQKDVNPLTFDEDRRVHLAKRLGEWFHNHSKGRGGDGAVLKLRKKTNTYTPRMLVMRKHSAQITALTHKLRAEDPSLNYLDARNQATSEHIRVLKKDQPEEWKRFEELAEDIRTGGQVDYVEQSEDALRELLRLFPWQMLNQVHAWSASLPIHLYCLAVFGTPDDPTMKSSLALSPSIKSLYNSDVEEQMRDLFLTWLEKTFGHKPLGLVETAEKAVHPDPHGSHRPMVPVEKITDVHRDIIRDWLRVFLTYLWHWQGGVGPVPWKKISSPNGAEYVSSSRCPTSVGRLIDPHDMLRKELEAWYLHLLAGQSGQLSESAIFQFSCVDVKNQDAPLCYDVYCRDEPRASQVKYTPESKLYALQTSQGSDNAESKASWHGLPLARTHHRYQPFDERTAADLRDLNTSDCSMSKLVDLTIKMESLGPVHTTEVSPSEPLNPHFSMDFVEDSLRHLISTLLPVGVFDAMLDAHDALALSTLITWLRSPNRFFHAASGTWRGGPFGVQQVIGAVARVSMTLIVATSRPERMTHELRTIMTPAVIKQTAAQLKRMSTWLAKSLQETNRVLKLTSDERSTAWQSAVVEAHLKHQVLSGPAHQLPVHKVTNGVPSDPQELASIYSQLKAVDPDITLGATNDMPKPATRRARTTRFKASAWDDLDEDSAVKNDTSAEQFNLDDVSSSDEDLEECERSIRNLTNRAVSFKAASVGEEADWSEATIKRRDDSPDLTQVDDSRHLLTSQSFIEAPAPALSYSSSHTPKTAEGVSHPPPAPAQPAETSASQKHVLPSHSNEPLTVDAPQVLPRRTERQHKRTHAAQEAIDKAPKGSRKNW
ncbi:hypothetical protein FRC12_013729 [Ceratobasidium sp. 428]|nr:hypothetical protein FRC12_013729 [Ceratobasidium sp. 428]